MTIVESTVYDTVIVMMMMMMLMVMMMMNKARVTTLSCSEQNNCYLALLFTQKRSNPLHQPTVVEHSIHGYRQHKLEEHKLYSARIAIQTAPGISVKHDTKQHIALVLICFPFHAHS